MKTHKYLPTAIAACSALCIASSATAATSLMFNYSQQTGNNIPTAGDVGADALVNVTGNAGTQTGTLDGVSYSMTHGDYWQQNYNTNLADPYVAVLEQNVTVTFNGLSAWLAANNATSYNVTVYYSGDRDSSRAVYLDENGGLNGTPDTVSVGGQGDNLTFDSAAVLNGGTWWAAYGSEHNFTSDQLVITNTSTADYGGISAIRIEAIPEPSSAALIGLGGLALIMRRRRA